jgi:hypothetical protein
MKELLNMSIDRLVDRLLSGELNIEDKDVMLALWIRLLLELQDIKNMVVNLY